MPKQNRFDSPVRGSQFRDFISLNRGNYFQSSILHDVRTAVMELGAGFYVPSFGF